MPEGLWILRGKERAAHWPAVAQVLEDLLTDELSFAIAVRGEDDAVAALQRRGDCLELRRFGLLARRPGRVETIWLQQLAGPALPACIDLVGLRKPDEMTFRRQDLPEAASDRGPQVPRLAGLLDDDEGLHVLR